MVGVGGMLGLFAVVVAAVVAHARHLHSFYIDQAFFALRYADRFARGNGLTWTDGERIEGYSSLVWVLATAGVSSLGLDALRATWWLGIGSTVAAAAALLWRYRAARPIEWIPGAFAALAIACSGPFAAWSISAVEATMVAALLAWAIVLILPLLDRDSISPGALIPAGLMLALLAISRPEGVVFGLGAAAGFWFARRQPREAGALLAWPVAAFVGQMIFRVAYHGNPLPSPVREQLAAGGFAPSNGVIYLVDAIPTVGAIALVAVAAWFWARKLPVADTPTAERSNGKGDRFLLVMLVVWLACVIAMGGDDLPARRFILPVLVLLAFLSAEALSRAQTRGAAVGMVALLAGVGLAIYVPLQLFDPAVQRVRAGDAAFEEARAVGTMLGTGFRSMRPRIALDQAGAIAYFSKLPAIDMLGTNDTHLSALSRAAHELTPGDGTIGDYLMSREPDLVLFSNPAGGDTALYRGGLEMRADPRFLERYSIVNLQTPEPYKTRSRIWIRRDGGPLAIQSSPRGLMIPGWHINADPASTVRLDDFGYAGVTVRPERVTGLTDMTLPAGTWVVTLDADLPGVNVWIRDSATEAVLAQAPDRVGIRYGGGTVDVALQSDLDYLVTVRKMVVERME
jgi:arabinofuranosyltransferase